MTLSTTATAYLTPDGLAFLAGYESGTPGMIGGGQTSANIYQFQQSTWNQYAGAAGVLSQYPTASAAPAEVQSAVAAITPASNWLCPGCDAAFSSAANDNPGWFSGAPAASSIVTGGAGATAAAIGGSSLSGGVTSNPTPDYSTLNPYNVEAGEPVSTTGSNAATAAAGGQAQPSGFGQATGFVQSLEDWATAGIVNVAIAVFALVLLLMALAPRQTKEVLTSAVMG